MPEESNQSKFENYSLYFDGSIQYIDLGSTNDLDFQTSEMSISFWINSDTASGLKAILGNSNSSSSSYQYLIDIHRTVGKISFLTSGAPTLTSNLTININTWYHVCIIKSGTTSNWVYTMYINGSSSDGGTLSTTTNPPANQTTAIGKYGALSGYYFIGKLTEVSIFDYALTDGTGGTTNQIGDLYNSGTPVNPMALTPAPVAYYDLGGSSTGEAGDNSANPVVNTLTVPNSSVPSATVFQPLGANQIMDLGGSNLWSNILVGTNRTGIATFSSWVKGPILTWASLWEFSSGTSQRVLRDGSNERLYWQFGSGIINAKFDVTTDINNNNTGISLNDDNWLHIVFVFKAGSVTNASGVAAGNGSQDIELFLNGKQLKHAPSSPASGGPSATTWGANTSGFYRGINSPSQNTTGARSNVQIWNSELTASEITTLYNSGRPYTGTQPQAANLKGWWRLNIDTSNWKHFSDTIASRNYWNFQNQVGSRNSVVSFDTSDYIDYPYISLSGAFTVSTWVKSSDGKPGEVSYGNYLSNSNQWGGGSNNNRNWVLTRFNRGVRFIGYNSTNGNTLWDTQTPQGGDDVPNMFDGEWHHVIAMWDGTTNSNGVKIFVDGILKGLGTSSGTNINTDNSVPIRAGSASTGFDYIGEQSNQQIWNIALTSGSASSVGDSIGGDAATVFNGGTPYDGTQPQASNLKGWWKLDNITTGIQDSSGNSNNGTNNGTVNASSIVSTLTGRSSGMTTANLVNSDLERSIPYSSYSMAFDGLAEDIRCGNSLGSSLSQAEYVTVSCWVYFNDITEEQGLWNFRSGDNTNDIGTSLSLYSSGTVLRLAYYEGGNNGYVTISNPGFSNENWYNIVCVYDKGAAGKIYINGQAQTVVDSGVYSTVDFSSDNFYIGSYYSSTYATNGNLSNIAVWNSELTSGQVLTVYNGGAPNDISNLSPIRWWSLSGDSYFDGNNFICPNLTSSSNNGTSHNLGSTDLIGNGPGSTANGLGTGMNIPGNLQGNAPNSNANAFSVNMNADDKSTSVPAVP